MPYYLIITNIRLGLELLGAIVCLIISWLFLEAWLLKKDWHSFGKSTGFFLLVAFQVLNAVGGSSKTFLLADYWIYGLGLLLILLSFWLERMPAKPKINLPLAAATGMSAFSLPVLFSSLLILIAIVLAFRYFKSIDRDIKWMSIAFIFLAAASVFGTFSAAQGDIFWNTGQILKTLAIVCLALWTWRFLSLRLREESLIVFTTISLLMALLVTTVFSAVLFQKTLGEVQKNLDQSAQISNFYTESLKSKSLAASQIISKNDIFSASFGTRDIQSLKSISAKLLTQNQEDFITASAQNGDVFFKNSSVILQNENLLREGIGAEASVGRPAVSLDNIPPEGLSIRASSLVLGNGNPLGIIITGSVLDKNFVDTIKKITGFETTLVIGEKIIASTVFLPGNPFPSSPDGYNGLINAEGQDLVAKFINLKNLEDKSVATIVFTTTPYEISDRVQSTNSLTVFFVFLITLGFIVPIYRFSVFLTETVL